MIFSDIEPEWIKICTSRAQSIFFCVNGHDDRRKQVIAYMIPAVNL